MYNGYTYGVTIIIFFTGYWILFRTIGQRKKEDKRDEKI